MYNGTRPVSIVCDFEMFTKKYLSGIGSPKKARLGLDLDQKSIFEDFYIKSFNWKRKRSNSNCQVQCEFQTTTNIAFLCEMVRVPFLLCVILEFPTRKYLSGIDSPIKSLDLDQQKSKFQNLYIQFWIGKENGQIPIFRLNANTRLLLT